MEHKFHIRYTETLLNGKTRRYHKITDTLEQAISIFSLEWKTDTQRLKKTARKMIGELHAWTREEDGTQREYQILPYTDWSPLAKD